MFEGGLPLDHLICNAMNLLNVLRNRNLGINEALEGGEIPAVEAKAYSPYLHQSMHDREQGGGFGLEREKSVPWIDRSQAAAASARVAIPRKTWYNLIAQ
jgi:hypothetical protein